MEIVSDSTYSDPLLLVESTWKVLNEKRVEDAVTLTHIQDHESDDEEFTRMVRAEKCVYLRQEKPVEPCIISFKSQSACAIVRMIIVSEAKVIEIYGACQEYIGTATANFLCEVEEMMVYYADIKLDQPHPECSLRLVRTCKATEMWLYGVQVIWEPYAGGGKIFGLKPPCLSFLPVDLSFMTVDKRLKNSCTPISKQAQKCKEFIKLYGSLTQTERLQFNPSATLPLFAMASKKENPTNLIATNTLQRSKEELKGSKKLQKTEHRDCADPRNNHVFSGNSSASNGIEEQDFSNCFRIFRVLLDESLQAMEKRLLKALDEKLENLKQLQEEQVQIAVDRVVRGLCLPEAMHTAKTTCHHNENLLVQLKTQGTQADSDIKANNCTQECSISSNLYLPNVNDSANAISPILNETSSFETVAEKQGCPTFDQNSNTIADSVPVHGKQAKNEVVINSNVLDSNGMISLLCSKISKEMKHKPGSVQDSDIENAIVDMMQNFQPKMM